MRNLQSIQVTIFPVAIVSLSGHLEQIDYLTCGCRAKNRHYTCQFLQMLRLRMTTVCKLLPQIFFHYGQNRDASKIIYLATLSIFKNGWSNPWRPCLRKFSVLYDIIQRNCYCFCKGISACFYELGWYTVYTWWLIYIIYLTGTCTYTYTHINSLYIYTYISKNNILLLMKYCD